MTEQQVFDLIRARLVHARSEHPVFARNEGEAMRVIKSEFDEFNDAYGMCEGEERVIDEGADTIVTIMRRMMGEHLTCAHCDQKDSCALAFDPYNSNGDCLADK